MSGECVNNSHWEGGILPQIHECSGILIAPCDTTAMQESVFNECLGQYLYSKWSKSDGLFNWKAGLSKHLAAALRLVSDMSPHQNKSRS